MVSVVLPDSVTAVLDQARAALLDTIHIGVLVPWANMVVEAELPRFGLDRVVFHYARLVPASRTTSLDQRFLRELNAAVPAAVSELSRLPLAGTLLACTSAGFIETEERLPFPVVSAFDALVTTLSRMSIDRIVLVAPYQRWLTAIEAHAFMDRGIMVLAQSSLDRDDEYSRISAAEIQGMLAQLGPTELGSAQAIVLSCTGWPTLGLLAGLENSFGMPVLSSNLAMAIHAMTSDGSR